MDAVVLLVNDDPDMLRSVADVLEARLPGVRAMASTDAREALGLVAAEDPDALVVDYVMEPMNGVAFLQAARALRPGVPCAFLTGSNLHESNARLAGADVVLRKPVDPEALVAAVGGLLRRRRVA